MSDRPAAAPVSEPRLLWLDVFRLLAILEILGFHWLRTCFDTNRYGLTWTAGYENVGIGFGQLHYLLIDQTGPGVSATVNNVMGLLFGTGWEAVNVFILLSGLGLAMSYRPDRAPLFSPTWYTRRFRRILVPFYCVAFPLLLVGEAFLRLTRGHGGMLGAVAAKLAGKNLMDPWPIEFLKHLVLMDPRYPGLAVGFFSPAWWFIPPILVGYLCFPALYRSVVRFGAIAMLVLALPITACAYTLTDSGLLWEHGWYFVIFHELFNFTLGIVVGRRLSTPQGRARSISVLNAPWTPLVGLAVFVGGNVASWFGPISPVCSPIFTVGLALLLGCAAVRLARFELASRLCAAIDPYYLYLLHQPLVIPLALVTASVFGAASRTAGLAVGFIADIIVSLAVVLVFQRVAKVAQRAWSGGLESRLPANRRQAAS